MSKVKGDIVFYKEYYIHNTFWCVGVGPKQKEKSQTPGCQTQTGESVPDPRVSDPNRGKGARPPGVRPK